MELFEQFLDDVERMAIGEAEFITAAFGDNWKEYARQNADKEQLIDIAWKQGRRAEILQRSCKEFISNIGEITEQNIVLSMQLSLMKTQRDLLIEK